VLPKKKWNKNSNIFLQKKLLHRKKAPKGQTNFLRPANEAKKRPKGQLKFFRPTNLKKFGLKKANLVTLCATMHHCRAK